MSGFSIGAEMRQCIHCGRQIRRHLKQCPYCREAQAEVDFQASGPRKHQGGQFRSGLLILLLSAVVQYFAGGYSPLDLPNQVRYPALTYLVPLLAVGGVGLSLYALFLRIRA